MPQRFCIIVPNCVLCHPFRVCYPPPNKKCYEFQFSFNFVNQIKVCQLNCLSSQTPSLNTAILYLSLCRLKQQGTREQFSYNEVVLKGAGKKLSLLGQTCAVCLEEFRTRDELAVCPCSHAFHKKCLLKWLEIRSVCPMCNKPILRLHPDPTQGTEGPQDPEEV
uniref:RING finger protein 122 n=1 Tax=Oncorhynchus mykiss TaxID=8022 RepID=A0A8C7W0D4_ONCMY